MTNLACAYGGYHVPPRSGLHPLRAFGPRFARVYDYVILS